MTSAIEASVIVPVFNGEATLARCLDALEAQDCVRTSFEIIVVDDGSTDSTSRIAGRPGVTLVHQENRGPAAARNRGAQLARGTYLLFTDADCVPDRRWLVEMLRPFAGTAIAGVKGAYLNESRRIWARFAQIEFEERYELLRRSDGIDMVDTYSAAFRREVFIAHGGFDDSFPVANNEDTELSYRLASGGHRLVFAPLARVTHLRHPDTIARYARLKFWRGYWRMVVYRLFPRKLVRDSYTPQTLKLQVALSGILVATLGLVVAGLDLRILLAALLLWILSILPFCVFALSRDPAVALFAPSFLFVRAGAIGAGSLLSLIRPRAVRRKDAPDPRDPDGRRDGTGS